jgi:hypothetical protein
MGHARDRTTTDAATGHIPTGARVKSGAAGILATGACSPGNSTSRARERLKAWLAASPLDVSFLGLSRFRRFPGMSPNYRDCIATSKRADSSP